LPVAQCLEVISEASRRLSDELKARHPEIAWKSMAGAGNVYRHDYHDVAALRTWDAVQCALPPLREVIEQGTGCHGRSLYYRNDYRTPESAAVGPAPLYHSRQTSPQVVGHAADFPFCR